MGRGTKHRLTLWLALVLALSGCTTVRQALGVPSPGDPSVAIKAAETRWLLIKNPRFGDVPSEPEYIWVEEDKIPFTFTGLINKNALVALPEIVAKYGPPPGGGQISPRQGVPTQTSAPAPARPRAHPDARAGPERTCCRPGRRRPRGGRGGDPSGAVLASRADPGDGRVHRERRRQAAAPDPPAARRARGRLSRSAGRAARVRGRAASHRDPHPRRRRGPGAPPAREAVGERAVGRRRLAPGRRPPLLEVVRDARARQRPCGDGDARAADGVDDGGRGLSARVEAEWLHVGGRLPPYHHAEDGLVHVRVLPDRRAARWPPARTGRGARPLRPRHRGRVPDLGRLARFCRGPGASRQGDWRGPARGKAHAPADRDARPALAARGGARPGAPPASEPDTGGARGDPPAGPRARRCRVRPGAGPRLRAGREGRPRGLPAVRGARNARARGGLRRGSGPLMDGDRTDWTPSSR